MFIIENAIAYKPNFYGLINCMDRDYFADPGINNSGLQVILKKSPFHYKKLLVSDADKTSEAFRMGTLIHALALGYPKMDTFIQWSGASFNSKAYKEFKEENKEGYHVLESEMVLAKKIYDRAVSNNGLINQMRDEMDYAEITCFKDRFGYRTKAKADALKIGSDKSIIWDLKTTADLFKFAFSAREYCYHMQRAWYCSLFEDALGMPIDFRLIVIEKKYPNSVVQYGFSDRVIAQGQAMAERAFSMYAACVESGVWYGPDSNIVLDWR